jgi:hypothetical protein
MFNGGDFQLKSLVENALPILLKHNSGSLPLHKYVRAYREQFNKEAPIEVMKFAKISIDEFLGKGFTTRRAESTLCTLEQLDEAAQSPEKKIELFPLLTSIEDKVVELGEFIREYLKSHPDALTTESGVKTNLKRIIKIYDYLVFGKEKTPLNTSPESEQK